MQRNKYHQYLQTDLNTFAVLSPSNTHENSQNFSIFIRAIVCFNGIGKIGIRCSFVCRHRLVWFGARSAAGCNRVTFAVNDCSIGAHFQAKKDKKEKKQAGSEGDFEIKPDKSVPQIDTSKWPLLLKVSELISAGCCASFICIFARIGCFIVSSCFRLAFAVLTFPVCFTDR